MELITILKTQKGIQINIPSDLLVFVAGKHPITPFAVNKRQTSKFLDMVIKELNNDTTNEETITDFQYYLDKVLERVCEEFIPDF